MSSWKEDLDIMIQGMVQELAGIDGQIAGILKAKNHWFAWDNVYAGIQDECAWKLAQRLDSRVISLRQETYAGPVTWKPNSPHKTYSQYFKPTTSMANGCLYYLVVSGTTGSVEPSWTTVHGASQSSGTIIYICDIWHFQSVYLTIGDNFEQGDLTDWSIRGATDSLPDPGRLMYAYEDGRYWDNDPTIKNPVWQWALMATLRDHSAYGTIAKLASLTIALGWIQYWREVVSWRNAALTRYTGSSPSYSNAYSTDYDRVS